MADNTQIFFDEVNGKFINYDHAYGNQCKDLIDKYCVETLALPLPPQGNAWEMWTKMPDSLYYKIANTPFNVPEKGDIVVWKRIWLYLPYGHISIFNEGNASRFSSMDQNWPLNSPCHIQQHNYRFVQGWLRKK